MDSTCIYGAKCIQCGKPATGEIVHKTPEAYIGIYLCDKHYREYSLAAINDDIDDDEDEGNTLDDVFETIKKVFKSC